MKRIVVICAFIISCLCLFGQNAEVKNMLKTIEGQWKLDDNNNVTYQRIVEVPEMKKDEIFNRVLNYFVYNYGSGKSVIQTQDKDNGLIVGKGLYENVFAGNLLTPTYIDAWHIVRVDVKDGKARIIITLTQYDEKITGGNTPPSYFSFKIEQTFPVNINGGSKNQMGKAFYYSHFYSLATLNAIEKAVKEGNTSKNIENKEW